MLNDISGMNPKGHVKLELYNEAGEVTFTKEKRNMVVLDANKIVANMMAQPSRKNRITDKLVGNTSFNGDGVPTLNMNQYREEENTVSINVGSNAVNEIKLEGEPYVTELISVNVDGNSLVIDEEVFIEDGPKGIVGFPDLGVTGSVIIKYRKVVNDMVDVVQGSEKVVVNGNKWRRSSSASDSNFNYTVNYRTGEIMFETAKSNVTLSYEYEMQYGLGFMGIGGLPANHPEGQPVSFSKNDKYRTRLDNEFANSRQPINFPLTIEEGKPEIDVLLAKNISSIERTLQRIELLEITTPGVDGAADVTENIYDYSVDVNTIDGKRNLLSITRAEIISGELIGRNLLEHSEVTITDAKTGSIRIAPTLKELGFKAGDKIELDYKLKAGTDHLVYQLNYSPVVELKAVRFENNLGAVVDIAVDATTKGMELGETGKVRVLNANAGTIEFTQEFETLLAQNPGKITVEYFVNSGTVVKFVTDFPKGVPGPLLIKDLEFIPDTSKGLIEYNAPNSLDEVKEIRINGNPITAYSINGTKITINDPSFVAGDVLVIRYDTQSSTHTIYTVAMFDQIDDSLSKMFNISGIGPVTKDKNTGMRITWSVTF